MTHPTTEALYDAIGPGITGQDPTGTLLAWLDGPGSLLGEVDDVVRDGDLPGWAAELTATGTHRTHWTAQLLGVVIPDGASDVAARALIQDRPAFRRGTVPALVAAAKEHLAGSQYVSVIERDGSPYKVRVQVYSEEVRRNLMLNDASASFEDGTLGTWGSIQGALVAVTNDPTAGLAGPRSLSVIPAAGYNPLVALAGSGAIPIKGGQTITVTMPVLSSAPRTGLLRFRHYNASNVDTLIDGLLVQVGPSQWTPLSITVALPATATSIDFRLVIPDGEAGDEYNIDAVQTEPGPTASAFRLPSTPSGITAALLAAKPAGLVLTVETVPKQAYAVAEAADPITYDELEDDTALTYTQKEQG